MSGSGNEVPVVVWPAHVPGEPEGCTGDAYACARLKAQNTGVC